MRMSRESWAFWAPVLLVLMILILYWSGPFEIPGSLLLLLLLVPIAALVVALVAARREDDD